MPSLLDKPFINTAEFAEVLHTNEVTIRESRRSGVLYGRPAPKFKRFGPRKIMYSSEVIKAWLEAVPDSRITDAPEPEGLREAREG